MKWVLTTQVISHNAQYEKFEMKLPGCDNFGTAYEFSTRAAAPNFVQAHILAQPQTWIMILINSSDINLQYIILRSLILR